MKSKKILYLLLLLGIAMVACKKDVNDNNGNNEPKSMDDLVIPAGFNWETTHEIDVTVNVSTEKIYQPKHRISLFKGDPASGGVNIAAGSTGNGEVFKATLAVPSHIENLYLVCEGPWGSYQKVEVPVSSGIINYTFGDTKTLPLQGGSLFKSTTAGPDCEEGCDETISGGGNVNITDGKTYCVADNFNGKINFQHWSGGGTLRVCGTATLTNNQYLESNCHIVIAEGGTLISEKNFEFNGGTLTVYPGAEIQIDNLDVGSTAEIIFYENTSVIIEKINGWGSASTFINLGDVFAEKDSYFSGPFENQGTVEISGDFEISGNTFDNYGDFIVAEKFTCYGNGATVNNYGNMLAQDDIEFGNNTLFINSGSIQTQDKFNVYDNASLENNGSIYAAGECDWSTGGQVTNNCQITADGNLSLSGNIKLILNTGYLKTAQKLNFWNNKSIELFNSCMIRAENMDMQCDMIGSSDLSSVIVIDKINVWNNADKFDGQIEVATTSGELNGGGANNFINGAYLTSIDQVQNYLPVTACNPEGLGEPSIVDTDNDGIPDDIDDYPEDPDRAFNNYFPDEESYATLAFEDLWPATGDYDFNDLVVAVFGNEITNADDYIVDIHINFVVLAVGASLDNGFGFQLESFTPDQFSSVSGMVLDQGYVTLNPNGTEAGQSRAVIIVTESVNDVIHRPGGSFFNTVQGNPTGTSDTVRIVMNFTEPVDRNNFGPQVYNPFIIKNQNRSVEIHLTNYPPTDLMDTSLFGTLEDASNPAEGKYYVTKHNLPWGLLMLEPFDYPVETAEIISAYNYFAAWAESGGMQYTGWYLDEPGYRNSSQIYLPNE